MLVKKVLENEAYNASKKKEEATDHGKAVVKSKRDKKARCYICNTLTGIVETRRS